MTENKHTKGDLKYMQSMSLDNKIEFTKRRIRGWYESWVKYEIYDTKTGKSRFATGREGELPKLKENEECDPWDAEAGQVYVSFSGGKDSTVLLHIARQLYPDIEAVFVNTGLEYPEIQQFVKTFDNVTILRPKMRFDEVVKKYGYPIISKEVSECVDQGRKALARKDGSYMYRLKKLQGTDLDKDGNPSFFNKQKYEPLLYTDFVASSQCCAVMKKKPAKQYAKKTGKKPMTAQMAAESQLRTQQWLKNGCNGFDMKSPVSNPMSFWTEQDVLQYIKRFGVPIASVYGDIVYSKDAEQTRLEDFGIDGVGGERLVTTGCDRTGCIFCAFGCHLEKSHQGFKGLKLRTRGSTNTASAAASMTKTAYGSRISKVLEWVMFSMSLIRFTAMGLLNIRRKSK